MKNLKDIVIGCFLIISIFGCSSRKKEVTKEINEINTESREVKKEIALESKDSTAVINNYEKSNKIETEIDFNGGPDLVIEEKGKNGEIVSKTTISGAGNVKIKRTDLSNSINNNVSVKINESNKTDLSTSKIEKVNSVSEIKKKAVEVTGFTFMAYVWLFLFIILVIIIMYLKKRFKL